MNKDRELHIHVFDPGNLGEPPTYCLIHIVEMVDGKITQTFKGAGSDLTGGDRARIIAFLNVAKEARLKKGDVLRQMGWTEVHGFIFNPGWAITHEVLATDLDPVRDAMWAPHDTQKDDGRAYLMRTD